MDLANLAFSIDSSDTLKAVQALDALRQTTQATTKANQDFQTQGDFLVTSMSSQGAGAARLSRQLGEIGDKFQDLVTQAEAARRAFDGSTASFDAWDVAQNKVEALGRAYGTTARGLDAYLQTANQLQMSSTQAAASVQRLTMALENQGAAAANIRQILSNNGVSINDLQSDQIDTLLTRIKGAFQNRPDSQQRTNDLRSVLGTFDPDVLGTFTNPNYVPIQEQRQRAYTQAVQPGIARQDEGVRARGEKLNQQRAEYRDLGANLGGPDMREALEFGAGAGYYGSGFMGASEAGIREMREQADPDSDFLKEGTNSQAGRLAFIKQAQAIAGRITPEMRADPSKLSEAERSSLAVTKPNQTTPAWWQYITSGQYSANDKEIALRFQEEGVHGVGIVDRLSNLRLRTERNIYGSYKSDTPTRPEPTALDQDGTGDTLSGFGDSRIQRYQAARATGRSLGIQGTESGGDSYADARSRTKAARDVFEGAYGKEDGDQNYKAARARAEDAQRRALNDDGDVQQANLAVGLSTMSIGDSAKAKAFIAYARQHGNVPVSDMAGQSLSQLMDPRTSANGNLPAGLLDNFNKQYTLNSQAYANEQDVDQTHAMGNLTSQAGIAGTGSANLQDLITYQNAYDASMKRVLDTTLATKVANDAITKSEAERSVQMQKTIGDLEAANDAAKKYNDTMDPDATGSTVPRAAGADRMAKGIHADIQAQADAMARSQGPAFDDEAMARFTGEKQTEQGNQAVKSSQDKVALAEQELQTQNKLLSVAGQRQGIQDKTNRDVQVELSFQKELAQAQASGDPGQVDKIQLAIAAMKRLKDAVAEVNLEAKAFKLAADAGRAIDESRLRISTAPSERGRLAAQQPVRDLAYDSQNTPAPAAGGVSAVTAPEMSPTQRAFLQTLSGPESGGKYNVRYTPDGGASFDDLSRHPNKAEPIKGSPLTSTAAGAYQILDSTWEPLARKYGLNDYGPANQDRGGWHLADDTYRNATKGGDLAADLNDPSKRAGIASALHSTWPTLNPGTFGSKFDANLHAQPGSTSLPNSAQNATSIGGAAAALDRKYDQQVKEGVQLIGEQDARSARASNAQLPFIARGDHVGEAQARNSQINDADELGPEHAAAEARAKQAEQERDYQRQLAATKAATDLTISSNKQMAAAYGDSTDAVQKLQDKLKVDNEAMNVRMSNQDKLARLTQLATQRMTEQTAATEQQAKAMRESTADQKAINDLGPFASEEQLGRKERDLDIARHNRENPRESDTARSDYASARTDQQTVKEQTDAVNNYKQAWQSAESATFSALNSVILQGGKAKDVLGSLASSLANIGLQTVEKSAGNWLTGLLGSATGGSTAASAGGEAFQAASALFAHATGAAFVGGQRVRAFATGGLIDRPTNFYSAGGETNLAGEMGTEAIMPLKRMPNGDLGVSTGGGGSRGSSGVTVNAPITVNGGSSGSSGMDPKAIAQMSSQLKEAVRQAVVAGIADEKRAGGSLYS